MVGCRTSPSKLEILVNLSYYCSPSAVWDLPMTVSKCGFLIYIYHTVKSAVQSKNAVCAYIKHCRYLY